MNNTQILAVDDDPAMSALYSVAFRNLPVELKCVEGRIDLRRALMEQAFDLMLVDLQLGYEHGLEIAEAILGDLRLKVPIVMVTAQTTNALDEYVRDGRCLGFEYKPIRLKDFGGRVLRHCNRGCAQSHKPAEGRDDPRSLPRQAQDFIQAALMQANELRLRSDDEMLSDGALAIAAHRWAGVSGIESIPQLEPEARSIEALAKSGSGFVLPEIRRYLAIVIEKLEGAAQAGPVCPQVYPDF